MSLDSALDSAFLRRPRMTRTDFAGHRPLVVEKQHLMKQVDQSCQRANEVRVCGEASKEPWIIDHSAPSLS